ncbi:MAG: hypothetical protein OEM52_06795 [bacterium]|nr:hypothetical protein [bacterium]
MILRIFRKIAITLSLLTFATIAFADDSEWLPFRTELRADAMKWEQDGAKLTRSVAALEIAMPLYKNLYAGPIVTLGQLDIKKVTPEFSTPHRLGFGATLQYRNLKIADKLRVHIIARADGQRQRVTENQSLGTGTIHHKQTVTAYHLSGIGEFEWKVVGWEIAPFIGIVGDRIDRKITIDGYNTQLNDWSGLLPFGGVRFSRWYGAYYTGLRGFSGGDNRFGIELSVGHDGARESALARRR